MPIDPTAVAVASHSFSRNPTLRQELLDRYPGSRFNDEGTAVLAGDALVAVPARRRKAITGLDVLDEAVFRAVPELRLVSKYGVGLDMIDLDAARRHGVSVRWTPGVNRQAVAELDHRFHDRALPRRRAARAGSCRRRLASSRRPAALIGDGRRRGMRPRRPAGRAHLPRDSARQVLAHDIRTYDEFYRDAGVTPVTLDALLQRVGHRHDPSAARRLHAGI